MLLEIPNHRALFGLQVPPSTNDEVSPEMTANSDMSIQSRPLGLQVHQHELTEHRQHID